VRREKKNTTPVRKLNENKSRKKETQREPVLVGNM
jgi:hypothetical protein